MRISNKQLKMEKCKYLLLFFISLVCTAYSQTVKTQTFDISKKSSNLKVTENGSRAFTNVEVPCSDSFILEPSNDVTINKQVWMSKNLNVEKFRNGDWIPQAKSDEEWIKAGENKQPAWCYYNNDTVNGLKYGKLYNWYAVNDPRGIAPIGYHVPTSLELASLFNFLGGNMYAGGYLKAKCGWRGYGNGNNKFGFSGLPGGYRDSKGVFANITENGFWWGNNEDGPNKAHAFFMYYRAEICGDTYLSKIQGMSIRCIKDKK